VGELRHEDATIAKNGYFLKRLVAVGPGQRIIGFGDLSERLERHQPGRLHVSIEVEPQRRRRGVWAELFGRLELLAKEKGARLLAFAANESDRDSMACLEAAGFIEMSRDIESRLDLTKLGSKTLGDSITKSANRRFEFTTLAQERTHNPNFARELYEMEDNAGQDVPATDRWRRMKLSEYVDLVHKSPRVIPDAWFIAKHGGEYIGESFLMKGEGYPKFITTGFTCVIREFRGKGVATSLKLRGLLWAKKRGVSCVKTWNDSQNAAILSLNRKLGFRRYATWGKFEKDMDRATPEGAL
jgi:GNAT superfamily N-acetyltransferase